MKTSNIIATAALLASTGAWAADASLTLEGVSDYRFRGISQSAGDPALQGSFDIAFDNGWYVGTWASNIDFGDDADIEVDWYGGYYWEINDAVGLDVMLTYYTYPGYDWNSDYLELVNSLYVGDFMFQYAYSNDFVNTGETGHYLAVDYSYPLAETAGSRASPLMPTPVTTLAITGTTSTSEASPTTRSAFPLPGAGPTWPCPTSTTA